MRHGINSGITLVSIKHSGGVLPQNDNFLTLNSCHAFCSFPSTFGSILLPLLSVVGLVEVGSFVSPNQTKIDPDLHYI